MNNPNNKILIFYHFQLENCKEQNVTSIPMSKDPITIKDTILTLPIDLSSGVYHFRFKSQMPEGSQKVIAWIDINNLGAKVPQVNGSIFVKILKLKDHQHNKLFHLQKLKKAHLVNQINGHMQHHQVHSAPKNITSDASNHKVNHPQAVPTQNHHQNRSQPAHPDPSKTQNPPTQTQNRPKQSAKTQIPPQSTTQQAKIPPVKVVKSGGSLLQDSPKKAQNELSKDIQQNLDTYKKQFTEQQTRKQNERVAGIQLEQRIRKWGYTNMKKINNLTTLLATLHQVWPEWEPVSLTDMLRPEQVSSIFKKAVIKVHPDKNRSRHFKQQYLSKRIFELLNQSRKQ